MRDILFRGKAINRHKGGGYRTKYKNGDWVYGLLERHYNERFKFPAEMRNTDGVSGIQVDYKTIGQFTGLCDKNGKKIFEGDIVRHIQKYEISGEVESTAVIIWNEAYSCWSVEYLNGRVTVFLGCEHSKIEVISNVYDNPELLKGE